MYSYNSVLARYSSSPLPPGQYLYTNQLTDMMKSISPNYVIPTEPVFLNHLLMHIGKKLQVVTTAETLEGVLTEAAIDHMQLTIDDINYHIRYPHVIYFKKA